MMNSHCAFTTSLAASLVLVLILPAIAPAQTVSELVQVYEFIELAAPDGEGQSRAYALNNTSQAIGWVESGENHHAAHWHNQVTTDLHGTVHFELLHPLYDQDYGEAFDISDADQVVGTARTLVKCIDTQFVITESFVLRPAVLTDLATPYPGDALTNLRTFGSPCLTAYDSAATGISNRNHVVGWADREDGVTHAFLVVPRNGAFYVDQAPADGVNDLMVDLGTLAASDPVSSATAVNDQGQITGYSYTITTDGVAAYRAFLVTPNDTDADGVGDQWFIDGGNGTNTLMAHVGTLGGINSWGRDINNYGEIVGESDVYTTSGNFTHAFVYGGGVMTDIGTLRSDPLTGFSAASAINDDGVIVGWAENDNRERRAFIYKDNKMTDLNSLLYLIDEDGNAVSLSITLTEARDINNDGVIVGWGTVRGSHGNKTRGFLLNPVLIDASYFVDDPNNPGGPVPIIQPQPAANDIDLQPIFGTPGHLLGDTADDPNRTGDTTSTTGLPSLPCGFGLLPFLPLTLAGLFWLKLSRRPVL